MFEEKEVIYSLKPKKHKNVVVECKRKEHIDPGPFEWMNNWSNWKKYENEEQANIAITDLQNSHKDYLFRIKENGKKEK